MEQDAQSCGPPLTYGDDPRITRVGRFLRRTKIDELPQLINVLKGDMSLVGPRPEVAHYVEMFRADYEEILQVRPGITDPASLKYRDEASGLAQASDPERAYVERVLPEKIRLAKEYVAQASFGLDLMILAKTLYTCLGDRLGGCARTVQGIWRRALAGLSPQTGRLQRERGKPMSILAEVQSDMKIPFFRPSVSEPEIAEVVACLRSGWLTTGPRTKQFEDDFAAAVVARHAVAVNSCTAALHLAVEALGLSQGQAVLVPTMTFAASAEVARYRRRPRFGRLRSDHLEHGPRRCPTEDCRPESRPHAVGSVAPRSGNHSGARGWADDGRRCGRLLRPAPRLVGGRGRGHAFPAAFRADSAAPWRRCGQDTAAITCFSFYSNKTITTGEGGMATTDDQTLADRMRQMSLHGLSHDAWKRYAGSHSWDYRIVAPGYKYNLTDIAAALGVGQLKRAEEMRSEREAIAHRFRGELSDLGQLELPPDPPDRIHSWHLFAIRLRPDKLSIDRNTFIERLRETGVGCSVHWRPLHLHPYYMETFGWRPEQFPVATPVWQRLISLPIFPGMRDDEQEHVIRSIRLLCQRFSVG